MNDLKVKYRLSCWEVILCCIAKKIKNPIGFLNLYVS